MKIFKKIVITTKRIINITKKVLIVAVCIISLLNAKDGVSRWTRQQAPVDRFVIKYTIKGFLANWNFDWLIK